MAILFLDQELISFFSYRCSSCCSCSTCSNCCYSSCSGNLFKNAKGSVVSYFTHNIVAIWWTHTQRLCGTWLLAVLYISVIYEGRSINNLQNGAIPSVLKIGKIRNIRFVWNLIRNIHTPFLDEDVITVTSSGNRTQSICVLFSPSVISYLSNDPRNYDGRQESKVSLNTKYEAIGVVWIKPDLLIHYNDNYAVSTSGTVFPSHVTSAPSLAMTALNLKHFSFACHIRTWSSDLLCSTVDLVMLIVVIYATLKIPMMTMIRFDALCGAFWRQTTIIHRFTNWSLNGGRCTTFFPL